MCENASLDPPPSRSRLIRDLLVFQVKLWMEGFKDFVLMPLSLGAALLDFLFRWATGGRALYGVMKLGDRFEQWVNLYGALGEEEDLSHAVRETLDEVMVRTENASSARNRGSSRSRGTEEGESN